MVRRNVHPRLLYIRGIVRSRMNEHNAAYSDDVALDILADAFSSGVSIRDIESIAKLDSVNTLDDLRMQLAN